MVYKGSKLRNTINGLNATVEDITRNGVFILSIEEIHLGFANICEKPFIRTRRIELERRLIDKYIKDEIWEIIN